ncbi:Rieske 2Fe-2S domain-containing protein [Tumidithrix elongata RA019]|uniref:Rieske 2Fe-2S domain-containing protein n=1 Tax=Tumidithrix elongata BACA0141 TaxID=2716417 RepID=A0AAW9PVL2_9CYAN|nr:Rieske 2Fe-2S domain-containing protein [Tumidithrix elongata RA019]
MTTSTITLADGAIGLNLLETDTIPAGGSDPTQFDGKEAWYPIFYVEDLDKAKLATFTLLERDLVIWWDKQAQTWQVFADRCPHRLAPLSQGRITEAGLLECPYHGWAFTGDGSCDRIPQQPEHGTAQKSKRACAETLPSIVRQGLLFVYAGQPENALKTKVPLVEPLLETPDEWVCLTTFRDLPYDALTLLENVLDSSHLPFTHHRSVGNRANASPADLEVVASSKQGFVGTWAEGPRRGKLGRQDTTFVAPSLMWHDLTSKQFGRTLTVVYATPIRKGECRLFAIFPFKFSSKVPAFFLKLAPRWYSHTNQNAILEDDQIFLHFQERYLEAQGGSPNFAKAFYLPTGADRFVTELRTWVNQYHADPFAGQTLPPAIPTEKLLDRYHSHTVKCASCSAALKNIQRLKLGMAILGAIAWASTSLFAFLHTQLPTPIGVLLILVTLVSGAAWYGLSKLERRFYDGQAIAPRNLPEKNKK